MLTMAKPIPLLRGALLPLFCLGLYLGSTPLQASPLCDRHKKWLNEEVVYIIAERERREFDSLESETERDQFIERFWALRDPDPATERNEFKEEHYRRIEYANNTFHDGEKGWKTERGRVYIIHGPPDDVSFVFGSDRLPVDVYKPTEVLTGGIGDSGQFSRINLVRPESELWLYRHIDGARNFSTDFEVVFSRVEPSQLYEVNQTIRRLGDGLNAPYLARLARDSAIMRYYSGQTVGGGAYKILYAGPYKYPDLDSLFQSIFHPSRVPRFDYGEIQLAMGDLERSPGEVLHDRLDRRKRLREEVESRISYEPFSMDLNFGSVRADSGVTMVPVTLGISREFAGDTLDLLVELVRPGGISVATVSDTLSLDSTGKVSKSASKRGEFLYVSRLSAEPGEYKLRAYGWLRQRNRTALVEREIRLPDYRGPDVQMSDILLFDKVIRSESRESRDERSRFLGRSSPIELRHLTLVPAADSRFRRGERLNAFVEVYNPGIDKGSHEPSLDLQCRLLRGGEVIASLPQKVLDYTTDAKVSDNGPRTTYGLSIPLAFLNPGEYSLELQVRDGVRGQAVSKRMAFQID